MGLLLEGASMASKFIWRIRSYIQCALPWVQVKEKGLPSHTIGTL